MAYLLRFDGSNDYVTFPQVLSGASSFDVEIDFVPRSISSSVYQAVYTNGQVSIANNRHAMYMWGGSRAEIAFIIGGTRRVLNSPVGTFAAGVRYKVNAVYDGSTLQILVNGTSVASIAATGTVGGSSGLTTLGRPADTEGRCPMDFYGFKVTAGGVLTRFYDPSNTSSGAVLPDTVSAQDGTLTNFTVPDCWVFYSSGATYQLTAQGGTFTYSGQTAAINRGFKLAAQGGTYSYTGASASLLRQFKLTAQGGSYSYAGASTSLLRGFKLAANGGAYSYAGANASLTYVAGPTIYRLTALGVTYVYSCGVAALTATGVIPVANPSAFINRARVAGAQTVPAKVGSLLVNNARIDGMLINKGRLAQ